MEITGRVTADALRKSLPVNREVVQFSIAVNDSYKRKGAAEAKKVTTFFDCSYWKNPAITEYVRKGTIVELSGQVSARAYKNMDGEPKASLHFHVNTIKLHGGIKKPKAIEQPSAENENADLPF